MECKIEKLTPFTHKFEDAETRDHNAVAAVTVGMGPVRLQTRLWHSEKDQRYWLQMPGRKLDDGKWFEYIRWTDQKLLESVRDRAVELYQSAVN